MEILLISAPVSKRFLPLGFHLRHLRWDIQRQQFTVNFPKVDKRRWQKKKELTGEISSRRCASAISVVADVTIRRDRYIFHPIISRAVPNYNNIEQTLAKFWQDTQKPINKSFLTRKRIFVIVKWERVFRTCTFVG